MLRTLAAVLLFIVLTGCSLAPEVPVSRPDLMRTRIFTNYIIDESPEELLYALNTRGEALIEAKRKIYDKEVPVYLKLMATADGVMVNEYDR